VNFRSTNEIRADKILRAASVKGKAREDTKG